MSSDLAPEGSFQPISVLGIDPGFASIGLSVVQMGPNPQDDRVVHMSVFQTKKASEKRKVRASEDNLERAKEISKEIGDLIQRWDVKLICAETMSFPRSSSAAAKMAMCWGVLAAIAQDRKLPITQASPQEIKKALCGKRDASKEEVQGVLNLLFRRDLVGPNSAVSQIAKSALEHPYDALAAVIACRESEVALLLRRMVPCTVSTRSSSQGA
jgi:crossover junction endodeoxyribonuclease RuvC